MKILLIDANSLFTPDFDYIGLGLPSIAAYLREKIHSLSIKIINKNIDEELASYLPDIIGISSVSASYKKAIEIAEICKRFNSNVPIIMGGHHITAMPNTLSQHMDIGVLGEGEQTIAEVCELFFNDKLTSRMLSQVAGIVYWNENHEITYTSERGLIEDIDSLPFPARDLLTTYEQKEPLLYTSRGCGYRCVFCSPSRFWKTVRYSSPEYVVNEIKHLRDAYGTEFIYFADDLLIHDKNRFKRIVELIEENNLNEEIHYKLPCRANLVDQELVTNMKRMNVTEVHFGLESMNEKTLKYLKGPNVTVHDNLNAIDILKNSNIKVIGNFVIGAPDETEEELRQTLDFVDKNIIDDYRCYLLTPLPGTPLWDYALKKSLVKNNSDMDWSLCWAKDITQETIILSKHISRERLREIFNHYNSGSSISKI